MAEQFEKLRGKGHFHALKEKLVHVTYMEWCNVLMYCRGYRSRRRREEDGGPRVRVALLIIVLFRHLNAKKILVIWKVVQLLFCFLTETAVIQREASCWDSVWFRNKLIPSITKWPHAGGMYREPVYGT